MRLRGIVLIACLLAFPALAAAQGYAGGAASQSIIRPAGYGWRNHVAVPDGPCGCAMPVRADCYNVCRPCGLRPLCFVQRVVRTLDCLLPCNVCCHGGGPLHGCVLGNRWGCGGGCCPNPAGSCFDDVCCSARPSCGCESCTSSVPMLSDPFQDDPLPPKPTAQPSHEVRRAPTPARTRSVIAVPPRTAATTTTRTIRPAAATRPSSPYKISTASTRQSSAEARASRDLLSPAILRQTSHERTIPEPAPHWIDQSLATPLIRSQSPSETAAELEIPTNPLRAR
jgi:hypothetical protein